MELNTLKRNVNMRDKTGELIELPALVPAYRAEIEAWKRLPRDKVINARVTVPRNTKLLKKFWAIANFVFDNLPEKYEFKHIGQFVDDYLKFSVGFTETYRVSGTVREVGKSMSFDKCTEA